jgi:hypothetical protein
MQLPLRGIMYDPAVDLVLRAVIAKEPYEKISEKNNLWVIALH